MQDNQIVHEFMKNAFEKVRGELCKYKGKDLINVRIYFQADREKGEWEPTRKGITMDVELIGELKEAIEKADAELEKRLN